MKYLTLIAILFGYVRSQTEETQYLPNVPDYISKVFEVIGNECTADSDCESLYTTFGGPEVYDNSNNAGWMCVNDTVVNGDNVQDISVCVFDGCDVSNNECSAGSQCRTFGQCNPYDNTIYPMEELESTMCVSLQTCNQGAPLSLEIMGDWTNETMCYEGEDGETYVSKEYAVICAETCIDGEDYVCMDGPSMMGTTDADGASQCVDDETCCSKDGWDEEGCLELLITTYLMYTIIVAVVICLCCIGCCCCIYKKKKNGGNAQFENDMDNQTNHYNVYI